MGYLSKMFSVCVCASAQCRLEANYAHQQELDMIPLMMQKDYKPQGWRKFQRSVLSLELCLLQHRHAADTRSFCS